MPTIIPQPNSKICLCSGIPWDDSYSHIRLFDSSDEQLNYFNAHAVKRIENSTYQRDTQAIIVPYVKEEIQNCNYLYFLNTSAGNKYYFAFITRIDFVNYNASAVFFEIDYFQTYFSQALVGQSFVQREIVLDDTFGKHVIPEGLETGEYVYNKNVTAEDDSHNIIIGRYPVIIMAVTEEIQGSLPGGMYDGIYNGLLYYACSVNNASVITQRIANYMRAGKANAIVNIFMYPGELLGLGPNNQNINRYLTPADTGTVNGGELINPFASLNGYTPKNNKLYCYPYRALCLWGAGGSESTFRYELFSNLNVPLFKVFSALGGSAPIMAVPLGYKGFNQGVDEAASMPPYPLCSWLTDNYSNWLAQNQISQNYNVFKSIAGGAVGMATAAATGNIAGMVNSFVGSADTVLSTMINREEHKIVPDSANGSTASTSAFFSNGQRSIFIFPKCIKPEQAQKIDDYFSMYGYTVNTLKIPAIRGRKYWNYVKTIGANIYGNIPVEAKNTFVKAFDNGVTFWHTNDLYAYSLNNSIL